MLLILIPTRHEAAGILRRLRPLRPLPGMPNGSLHAGAIGSVAVTLLLTGMGPEAADRATRAALAHLQGITAVVLAGYAGGLDPALRVGDLLVKARAPALTPGNFRPIDTILDASVVLADTAAKAEAFRTTGACVVDMESRAVEAALADRPELPFYIIRAVSDAAEHRLPEATLAFGYDMATSRETPGRMAWHLLTHPGEIGPLLTFLKRLPPAHRQLTEFILDRLPELAAAR